MQLNRQSSHKPADRPLRVLHIGNIANNAYLNARLLNDAGLDCDVLCNDYYHIMGCPEWEDADFVGKPVNEFRPDWNAVDLQGFLRPRWFAQGPLRTCVNYLYRRRKEQVFRAAFWWHILTKSQYLHSESPWSWSLPLFRRLKSFASSMRRILSAEPSRFSHFDRFIKTLSDTFPDRHDVLCFNDIAPYQSSLNSMKRLFAEYDIVQGYGVSAIWPLLAGKRPYIAFEHGTIRSIPFVDSAVGRLTALAYHQADSVIITNADSEDAAKRLKVQEYHFVPHPVNEKWIQRGVGNALREQLLQELHADFLVFHPSRQHWEAQRHPSWEKGNDIFIKGMAHFIHEVAPRAAAIFVAWGQKIEESMALLAQLGIANRIKWIPPQHSANMSRYIDACDLVADQFFLGAFGSIMPKSLAMGKPVIIYLDEKIHRWCLPEMPPIINARTPDEVLVGLTRAYQDPVWLRDLGDRGLRWYRAYHSNAVIREELIRLYRDVLSRYSMRHLDGRM